MIPNTDRPFDGIYVATVCPMHSDGAIDEAALAQHFRTAMSTNGIVGVLVNGHAGENFALSREEKRRVTEIAAATIGDRAIIVCGINAEDSFEAQRHARDAEAAGADVLMVFPPFSWVLSLTKDMALTHHRMVAEASGLPQMLYQASVGSGRMAYDAETLAALVTLPNVVGIKEGSWETARYEANRRLVREIAPHVAVMASGDEHLLSCFLAGSEGSLVSLAVLVPDAIVALDRAVRRGDLEAARAAHERIYPLARAIYGTSPSGYATARLKTCMRLAGLIDCDHVRPPMGPLNSIEISRLRDALEQGRVMCGPRH